MRPNNPSDSEEFDEKAASVELNNIALRWSNRVAREYEENGNLVDWDREPVAIKLARWQHAQMSAQVAALREKVEYWEKHHMESHDEWLKKETAPLYASNREYAAEASRLRDRASVLKWALRRAMDALEYGDHPVAARKEVLKILADNGLEYDDDGHLVERKK